MAKMNKWEIMGNLAADPEIRYTQNGDQVMSFRVAVDGGYKKDGEWVENTLWVRTTVFGDQRIDYLKDVLQNGSLVYVEGRLKPGIYDGQKGPQLSLDLFANDVQPLARLVPKEEGGRQQARSDAAVAGTSKGKDVYDDLPF